jgi:predicted nucleic acid-binding protein
MSARNVYLDTSIIVKRYIEEKGSKLVDDVYGHAEVGALKLSFSMWNVGELIGALDQHVSRKVISEMQFRVSIRDFVAETMKLFRLGHLNIRSPTAKIFADAWYLVFSSHIYEADAIQIATAKSLECDLFLSADAELIEVAKQTNLQAANVETEAEKILDRLPKGKQR